MTEVLAIIGAVTGVIGLALTLRREWLDRSKLKVQVDSLTRPNGTGELKAIIENEGRRPVTIGRVGFEWKVEGPAPHRPQGELLFNNPWDRDVVPAHGSVRLEWDVPAKPYTHLDCPLRGFAAFGRNKKVRTPPRVYYRELEQMGWQPDKSDPSLVAPLSEPLVSQRVEPRWKLWRPRHLRQAREVPAHDITQQVAAARARVKNASGLYGLEE